MYRVITSFIDLQDGEHPYNPGDAYPHDGRKVDDRRIAELSGSNNKRRMPLIEKVEPPKAAEKEPGVKPSGKGKK